MGRGRDAFQGRAEVEETPEAFEGLSAAASWLDDSAKAIEAREHAYRLYREREDWRGAARTALWLAFDYVEFRDERAIANGWLGRARRLLEGHEPSAEHGWLLLAEGHFLLRFQRDAAAARKLASLKSAIRNQKLLAPTIFGISVRVPSSSRHASLGK